jgi:hypothetical protein
MVRLSFGANFRVVAQEADEGDFVLVHNGDLRFVEFPVHSARVSMCQGMETMKERLIDDNLKLSPMLTANAVRN